MKKKITKKKAGKKVPVRLGVAPIRNYGIDWEKEKRDAAEGDTWVFGAASKESLFSIPHDLRSSWLPQGEIQAGLEDFMDCASRGPNNLREALFSYGYVNKLFDPRNLEWLKQNYKPGPDGRIRFSDRFVAINSGTTRQGNSLKAPLEAIRTQGLIPKDMLPASPTMSWDEYHNPKAITQEMRDLGAEFARRFTLNYEIVDSKYFPALLQEEMLDVAGYAWPTPVDGVYPRVDAQPNHCFILFALPMAYAFDNYIDPVDGDFIKKLAPDYGYMPYAYRVFIGAENPEPVVKKNLWTILKRFFSLF